MSQGVPLTPATLRGTIRELDGLRGLAIFLVIIHHFWPREGPWAAYGALPHLGWIGVDLFFVVSGLLITGILLDTRHAPDFFKNFYARRSLRIFPLYYLFLLFAFVGVPALQGGPWAATEFVRESGSPWWYLLYQGNLREAITGHEPAYILAPLWSLSIEEQFYLVFPLLVYLLSRTQLRTLLLGAICFAPVFRIVTMLIWPLNERVQYLATPARLDALALGALMALGIREGWLVVERRSLSKIVVGLLVVLGASFALGGLDRTTPFGRTIGYSIVAFTFAALVLWVVSGRETSETAPFRWGPLRELGKVCYGVYVLQRPVEVVVGKVAEAVWSGYDRTALYTLPLLIAATFLAATLSWNFFERPILRLKHYFAVRGHPQGP